MAKQSSPYASDMENTELYVKVAKSGISTLITMIDGLTITTFNKGKTPYLSVPDVIEWHAKEMAYTQSKGDKKKREQLLVILREALEHFETVRGQYGKRE